MHFWVIILGQSVGIAGVDILLHHLIVWGEVTMWQSIGAPMVIRMNWGRMCRLLACLTSSAAVQIGQFRPDLCLSERSSSLKPQRIIFQWETVWDILISSLSFPFNCIIEGLGCSPLVFVMPLDDSDCCRPGSLLGQAVGGPGRNLVPHILFYGAQKFKNLKQKKNPIY